MSGSGPPIPGACSAGWRLGGDVPGWLDTSVRAADLGVATRVLQAGTHEEVLAVIREAWQASLDGCWVCGWVSYEAAPALDAALPVAAPSGHPDRQPPLALFVIAPGVSAVSPAQSPAHASTRMSTNAADTACVPPAGFAFTQPWRMERTLAHDDARSAIEEAREAIAAGRYYQLNLTGTLIAEGEGSSAALFERLAQLQPAMLGFRIETPDWSVVSASPELFFEWDGQTIRTRPMKGTAPPSGDPQADRAALQASDKDRAENVMIVDLLRNDLSRIALPGSVSVPSLFDVHTHPTVVQMSSCIQARTRPGTGLDDVFRALFPCGSVTGAPKREAMSHLLALEQRPRGVYCGAVGLLAPGGRALFNVAIRTLVHDRQTRRLRYSVGSGLTWYSSAQAEWDEWQWKSRLAHRCAAAFQILETVRLQDGQWQRLSAHLARMSAAALHFGYGFSEVEAMRELQAVALQRPQGTWRGRWLLDADGNFTVGLYPLDALPLPLTLQWADEPLDAEPGDWPFIRYKTTWRVPYDRHASALPGRPDVLMRSTDGQPLETPRGNLVIADADGLWTPASRWQLPGVLQQELLAAGTVHAKALTLDQLLKAQAVWVVNSLRGWMPVTALVSTDGTPLARWTEQPQPPGRVLPAPLADG